MANDVSVKVGAENSALNSGLAQAKKAVEGFKNHTESQFEELKSSFIGIFAVGAVIESVKSLLDEFGRVQDLADRFDESASSLQRIGEAAKLSGTDLETVAKGVQKAGNNALAAVKGNEALAESFQTLGTTAGDFVNLSMEDKLLVLSKGFEDGGSRAELLAASMEILGKSGAEMAVMLGQGPAALRKQFEEASVASDESVAQLAAAGDKIDKTFGAIKAAGATALAFIIDKAQVLWAMLNTIGVFLSELPNGLKAATEAANDFSKDFFENRDKENAPKEQKKKVDVDAIREKAEAAAKAKDEEKKSADELAKVKEENARKEQEAYMRSLSLLEKRLELESQLRDLQNKPAGSELDAEKNKGKALDVAKELDSVNKELEREQDARAKKELDDAKKAASEKAREELKAKKDELRSAQSDLNDLEKVKNNPITVDALREIGGGLAGVNYSPDTMKEDLQKQQTDYARQSVEKLTQMIRLMESANQPSSSGGDGSFTDE